MQQNRWRAGCAVVWVFLVDWDFGSVSAGFLEWIGAAYVGSGVANCFEGQPVYVLASRRLPSPAVRGRS